MNTSWEASEIPSIVFEEHVRISYNYERYVAVRETPQKQYQVLSAFVKVGDRHSPAWKENSRLKDSYEEAYKMAKRIYEIAKEVGKLNGYGGQPQ